MVTNLYASIRQELRQNSNISSLVGPRIRPLRLESGGKNPAIRMQKITLQSDETHEGKSGYDKHRIQLDIFADKHSNLFSVYQSVRKQLQGKTGVIGDQNQTIVGNVQLDDEQDLESDRDQQREYRKRLDFIFETEKQ